MNKIISLVFILLLIFNTSYAHALVCDGSDQSSEIQEWLNNSYGTIKMPTGICSIGSSGIYIPENVSIDAEGQGVTFLDYFGSGDAVTLEAGTYYGFIKNISIRNKGTGKRGITGKNINFYTIENVSVTKGGANNNWSIAGIDIDADIFSLLMPTRSASSCCDNPRRLRSLTRLFPTNLSVSIYEGYWNVSLSDKSLKRILKFDNCNSNSYPSIKIINIPTA
jgi:hypothetical protein